MWRDFPHPDPHFIREFQTKPFEARILGLYRKDSLMDSEPTIDSRTAEYHDFREPRDLARLGSHHRLSHRPVRYPALWPSIGGSKRNPLCGDADVMAKQLPISYRLRNETSHNLNPTDPALAGHYDEYRLWLLQAIFTTFF